MGPGYLYPYRYSDHNRAYLLSTLLLYKMAIELVEEGTSQNKRYVRIAYLVVISLFLFGGAGYLFSSQSNPRSQQPEYLQCKQTNALAPSYKSYGLHSSSKFFTPQYQKHSANLLSEAIQIPTISYDDMLFDVTKDPRFEVFLEFHDFLSRKFPLLSRYVEKVNTYGLLYTVQGNDSTLKPILFMAHQDVVPVPLETLDQWIEDPFEGVIKGEWILGRGSSDTKNSLIAICEAVESLLFQNFKPVRTLLISFGFDEEVQGWRGARKLADRIEREYGPDSVDFIIDEGMGMIEKFGSLVASPAVAEKGRVNLKVTLNTPGGHSSMPPDHTGIGIMSELVAQLESDVPFLASMCSDVDVVRGFFSCVGHFANDECPSDLKNVLKNLGSSNADHKLVQLLAENTITRAMVETTQAIDIIHGGVKTNALPEEVVMEVNYRVKPASSVEQEIERFCQKVEHVCTVYGIGANFTNSFRGQIEQNVLVPLPSDPKGNCLVEVTDWLDVAPISPFYNSTHWDLIGATTKHVVEDIAAVLYNNTPVVMAPSIMTGNTDTAHYWNLTKNIYRFTPMNMEDAQNMHTVNEGLKIRAHLSTVAFFYDLLINFQELPKK